jgi:hypothetical protein
MAGLSSPPQPAASVVVTGAEDQILSGRKLPDGGTQVGLGADFERR